MDNHFRLLTYINFRLLTYSINFDIYHTWALTTWGHLHYILGPLQLQAEPGPLQRDAPDFFLAYMMTLGPTSTSPLGVKNTTLAHLPWSTFFTSSNDMLIILFVKPLATVQPESCSLGPVNWCWSGISSQIPRAQYSCCDSCLSFDFSLFPLCVTVQL